MNRFALVLAPLLASLLLAGCGKAPHIERFAASTAQVPLGTNVTLSWVVQNAERIEISDVGEVSGGAGTVSVRPGETRTYVLSAFAGTTRVDSAPVTVAVGAGLDLRLGVYAAGAFNGTVALARVRNSEGAPPSTDTAIDVHFPGDDAQPLHLTCPAGATGCYALFPQAAPIDGSYLGSATVDGTVHQSRATLERNVLGTPDVTASRAGPTAVSASWTAVEGARAYRITVRDLGTRSDVASAATAETSASVPVPALATDADYAVVVEAFGFDPRSPSLPDRVGPTPVARGVAYLAAPARAWRLATPNEFVGGTLTLTFPSMGAGERLAVLPLNLTRIDHTSISLSATNVSPPAEARRAHAGPALEREGISFHAWERIREAEAIRQLPRYRSQLPKGKRPRFAPGDPMPATTSFCVLDLATGGATRRGATLKAETAHGAFYVDTADLPDYVAYEPPAVSAPESIWTKLGDAWENNVYPVDTSTFGSESDVDDNGKLIILFTDVLGPAQSGGILLGYYNAGDIIFPKDLTGSCTQNGGNRGDIFYMNGIANLLPTDEGPPSQQQIDDVVEGTYPDTLAHELQHLINFNEHFLVHGAAANGEDTWINEGLAVTAEDLAGFGWNRRPGRQTGAVYLNRVEDPVLRYSEASLTLWEASPVGNYEGTHTYFRLWADQRTPSVLGQLVRTPFVGVGNLEAVLGVPFEWAFATWTTALMFSNETFSPGPRFDYTGAPWTPLHQKLASYNDEDQVIRQGYLRYAPLGTTSAAATLRTNGYNAFLTGAPLSPGQDVTLTVTAPATARPHVVVVRFTGELPPGVLLDP